MPGKMHGPSIKNPKAYEAMRDKGMSKERAAAISNAAAKKGAAKKAPAKKAPAKKKAMPKKAMPKKGAY